MPIFILILTTIFILSALVGSPHIHIDNPFLSYIFYQLDFILEYFFLFFITCCIAIFLLVRKQKFNKRNLLHRNYFLSFFQVCAALITSVFLAFVILFIVAWIELTSVAAVMNTNPGLLGVTTNTRSIVHEIQKNNRPPIIIASDKNQQNEVVAIASATTGTDTLYGNTLLTAVPQYLILPIKKFSSSLLLIDNTLIVTSINIADMQVISPIVGYLFVQEYFPTRAIRYYPHTSIMNATQYMTFRKTDVHTKLAKVLIELQKMKDSIGTTSAIIQQDKDKITTNTIDQQNVLKQRDKAYDTCISTGTYLSGIFHPTYSKDDCQKVLDIWETTIQSQGHTADSLSQKLIQDQQLLKDYQYYKNFYTAQQSLLAVTTNNIPAELGIFEPTSAIKIVVDNTSSHAIADYFETVVHEYLHYASYTPGKKLDSSFFEEGLTEYFARQAIQDSLQVNTDIGYPVEVKIIQEITKRIAEVDLADIYFTKDQAGLEKILNLVYGDNFYRNNLTLFESLLYTSDPQQELHIANMIMKKLGGAPLQERDLFSTQSSL